MRTMWIIIAALLAAAVLACAEPGKVEPPRTPDSVVCHYYKVIDRTLIYAHVASYGGVVGQFEKGNICPR